MPRQGDDGDEQAMVWINLNYTEKSVITKCVNISTVQTFSRGINNVLSACKAIKQWFGFYTLKCLIEDNEHLGVEYNTLIQHSKCCFATIVFTEWTVY